MREPGAAETRGSGPGGPGEVGEVEVGEMGGEGSGEVGGEGSGEVGGKGRKGRKGRGEVGLTLALVFSFSFSFFFFSEFSRSVLSFDSISCPLVRNQNSDGYESRNFMSSRVSKGPDPSRVESMTQLQN